MPGKGTGGPERAGQGRAPSYCTFLIRLSSGSDMADSQGRGGAGRGGTKVRAGGRVLQCLEACESSAHLHIKR